VDNTGNYVDGRGPELRESMPGRNNEQHQSRVDIILSLARGARNDVDMVATSSEGNASNNNLSDLNWRLCYNMETIIHDIGEKCG